MGFFFFFFLNLLLILDVVFNVGYISKVVGDDMNHSQK